MGEIRSFSSAPYSNTEISTNTNKKLSVLGREVLCLGFAAQLWKIGGK